jgi:peptide/nickel transport system permease protein
MGVDGRLDRPLDIRLSPAGQDAGKGNDSVVALRSGRYRTWTVLRRDPWFWLGAGLVISLALVAILAPLIAPHDPMHQYRSDGRTPQGDPLGPTSRFPLGTDIQARDYLSRLIFGARTSLIIALVANFASTTIGLAIGAVAAFSGTVRVRVPGTRRRVPIPVESLLMRFTDLALSFPVLLLAIALSSVVGASIGLVVVIIAAILWATTARIVYGRGLVLRDAPFVEAARAVGVRGGRILLRHVLPHILPLAVVYGALGVAASVLFETTLSFLGAGVQPPDFTWGTMLADHISYYRSDPRLVVLPGLAVTFTVLGFTLLGDSLRDALDPRARPGRLG